MKAHLTSTKVSIYYSVKHKNEYFEATGHGTVKWTLSLDHNNHEVHQIKLEVPDQTLNCHLWFLDNDGQEIELVNHEVELKEAHIKAKQLDLNSPILPSSIDFNNESPIVSFIGDPEEIF